MKYKPGLDETVERMRRLWALEEPLDRVPCAVALPQPPRPGADGAFFGDLDGYLAHQQEVFRIQAQVSDDWLPTVHPQYGHALISALCGSPISGEAGTVWSTPILDDWAQLDLLHLDWDSEVGARCRSDYARLLEWARGACAVARYETEGIADTMAALRGTQRLLYDMIDDPEQTTRFACIVSELLIEFCRWNFENVAALQDLRGGSASNWGLWHPAGSIHMAEDASVLIGREAYRRFFKQAAARLTSVFPRSLMEVHREGNHQLPEFGAVEGIGLLVVENPLHMSPPDRQAVLALRGRKAFMFSCEPREIEAALQLMGPRGVYLSTHASTPEEGRELLRMVAEWTAAARRSLERRPPPPEAHS